MVCHGMAGNGQKTASLGKSLNNLHESSTTFAEFGKPCEENDCSNVCLKQMFELTRTPCASRDQLLVH